MFPDGISSLIGSSGGLEVTTSQEFKVQLLLSQDAADITGFIQLLFSFFWTCKRFCSSDPEPELSVWSCFLFWFLSKNKE